MFDENIPFRDEEDMILKLDYQCLKTILLDSINKNAASSYIDNITCWNPLSLTVNPHTLDDFVSLLFDNSITKQERNELFYDK